VSLSAAAGRVRSSVIRDLIARCEGGHIISLAGGLPAPDGFPTRELAAAVAGVLLEDGARALQYSGTQGYEPLREWVAARHRAQPEEVLITSGSQQALDLVARASVDPGVEVALTDPGYVGAIQALRLAGAQLAGVPGDDDGMLVDALDARLSRGLRPALVYVVPNFHNPTGATMAAERCRALGDLADHYGFLIVEDDPYRELRWAGQAPPPMATITSRAVTVGSFSKILCPGLRVGYLVAPASLVATLVRLKQATDLQTGTLSQRAIHRLVTDRGFLDAHLARIRALYQAKAATLVGLLQEHLAGDIDLRPAEGGMFVWAHLRNAAIDAEELLTSAIAEGVAYVPGAAFAVEGSFRSSLRLSFATATPEELGVGVLRLRRALAAYG
jgi:2-aminoadipate transaminase